MIYLIIAIILLVIIAPIVHVLPSRAQKLIMAKRRQAMSEGIGVELVKIEDPDPDPKKYQTSTGKPLARELSVTAYRMHRGVHAVIDAPRSYQLLCHDGRDRLHFDGNWYWPGKTAEVGSGALADHLSEALANLPADVVQVEEKNNFVSLYWHEAGEVTEVIDFLKRTAAVS